MTGSTDPDLIAEATGRFLRLREEGSDAARLELRRWMATDLRHAAAIDLVERGWRHADALASSPGARPAPAVRAGAQRRWTRAWPAVTGRPARTWAGRAAALAAAIALLVGADRSGVGIGWPHHYATTAAVRDVALADGSRLRLLPHSRAIVRVSPLGRIVSLDAGAGAFIVAHERHRPFVVRAGTVAVEATGTRFSVATGAAGTRVALWQGGVRLRDRISDAVLARLVPGDRAAVGSSGRMVLTHPRLAPAPAPASAFVFDDTPLADAVAQIAGGTGWKVRFARPGLARRPVSSVYHGSDLPAFLDDLAAADLLCWRRRGSMVEIGDMGTCKTGRSALP
jgi:transmembrane sensor